MTFVSTEVSPWGRLAGPLRRAGLLRIAIPTFGLFERPPAQLQDADPLSREEILDLFEGELRPADEPPGLTAAEAREAALMRRLRAALYPPRRPASA